MESSDTSKDKIAKLAREVSAQFEARRSVLSFGDWYGLLCRNPEIHARSAAQYVRDAFDYFGRYDVRTPRGKVSRFRLFESEFDRGYRLVGQEEAQNAFYDALAGFARLGRSNKLLLLHGPNGSSKSTMLDVMQRALEAYSQVEEGAVYRFSWVFPTRATKEGGIGFGPGGSRVLQEGDSFARLDAAAIDARIVDEVKDHPIFLIPMEERAKLLEEISADRPDFVVSDVILQGLLSDRNRKIYDALMSSCEGDLEKVLQHVRVERFFFSRAYRSGVVTVEPKQTTDARSFPVTGDQAFASLPPSVGGQVLYGCQGDLVDGNRGVVSFSDLLKRPYEHYKYLLDATEAGHVTLDHVVLGLDVVFTGSANDLNLVEFRALRAGDFQSFRERLDFIRVPYLLDYRVERKIYQEQVGDLLRGIHVAPHVPRLLSLWGVMTRLRRPNHEHYDDKLETVMSKLTPLEKADLYAYGRVPRGLTSEEARGLLAAVPDMYTEKFSQTVARVDGVDHLLGDYEGSFGASVRDLKGALLGAASEPGVTSVTVPRLFDQLRRLMRDTANHPWMALGLEGGGFHLLDGDEASITKCVWERWLELSDREVREALGLVDEERYLELFKRYVIHASHHVKRERLLDAVTGKEVDPDEKFMKELETTMDPNAGEKFREDVLARIGAWALSHPNEDPAYEEIFADYFARLREDYYRQQKETVSHSIQRMLELLTDEREGDSDLSLSAEEENRAGEALDRLLESTVTGAPRERHNRETLQDTLVHLSRTRYDRGSPVRG